MNSEDYWLIAAALFVASGLFDILITLINSESQIRLGLISLGFGFLLIGFCKYGVEKVKKRKEN